MLVSGHVHSPRAVVSSTSCVRPAKRRQFVGIGGDKYACAYDSGGTPRDDWMSPVATCCRPFVEITCLTKNIWLALLAYFLVPISRSGS